MAISTYLEPYKKLPYIRVFNKVLAVIEPQLKSLGARDIAVEVDSNSAGKSFLRRALTPIRPNEIDQTLLIGAAIDDLLLELDFGMINKGWLAPAELYFQLPVTTPNEFVCQRKLLGRKWTSTPANVALCNRIDAALPKVRKDHHWLALYTKLHQFYQLSALEDSASLLMARTGLKPGITNKPKINLAPFVEGAKHVTNILQE